MKQHLSISISNPCSEKFNQFKQTTTGGLCNSCQKEVIDFRQMSDEQLTNYFKNKQSNTCGYFETSQLKGNIKMTKFKDTQKFKFLRIAALAIFSLMSLHTIQAQDKVSKTEIVQKVKNDKAQDGLLTGIVSDASGPLPSANIILKGTSIGTSTNFDGEFKFPKVLKEGDVLLVSYIGYETQTIKIKKNQSSLNITMKEDDLYLLGEVQVNEVYKSKRN